MTELKKWNRLEWRKLDSDAIVQKMKQYYKSLFRVCLEEIEKEVTFRPGMWKMVEAQEHFLHATGDLLLLRNPCSPKEEEIGIGDDDTPPFSYGPENRKNLGI